MSIAEVHERWSEYLDPNYIKAGSKGVATVLEEAPGGKAIITFEVEGSFLLLKPSASQHQVRWLRSKKCADAALFVDASPGVSLHLLEIKGRINDEEWIHIQEQILGMYLNATALSGLLCLENIKSIVCYIAYKEEKLSASATATPVLMKKVPGTSARRGVSWNSSIMPLPFGARARLVKRKRDKDGNLDFGLIT